MREGMGEDGRQEHGPADDAASDSGDPLIGQTLAERYRIEGVIGSGAMGTVYAAEHVTMKRLVALKVMRPDLMKHERLIRRFQREAQASSRVVSPNVVLIYDFGHDESGRDFLAMERLSGESLGDVLRRDGSIPVLDAVGIAMGIARALEAAHSAGVVHRDLKPDNVFITEEGTVKVLDFGIAKIFEQGGPLEDMSTFTGIGAIAGTPLYMSPEAARRHIPRYPLVSATLIGRLAIVTEFQGQGLGSILLARALRMAFANADVVGSSMVVVDAIDERAAGFYEAHGFTRLPDTPRLIMPMRSIAKLIRDAG